MKMEKRICKNSGLDLSILGTGCWAFGGGDYWGDQTQKEVNNVVHASVNMGINYFDTAEAYRNYTPGIPFSSLLHSAEFEVAEWKKLILNDFEEFAFSRYPVIKEIKEDLYNSGALFSLMSGSGSSVYGIFSNKPQNIAEHLNGMIIWEGVM